MIGPTIMPSKYSRVPINFLIGWHNFGSSGVSTKTTPENSAFPINFSRQYFRRESLQCSQPIREEYCDLTSQSENMSCVLSWSRLWQNSQMREDKQVTALCEKKEKISSDWICLLCLFIFLKTNLLFAAQVPQERENAKRREIRSVFHFPALLNFVTRGRRSLYNSYTRAFLP